MAFDELTDEISVRLEPSPTNFVAVTTPLVFILVADKFPMVDIPVAFTLILLPTRLT